MKSIINILIITLLLVSCTEEFPIEFPNNQPKLVVEGIVTDQPAPNYVRLTLSKSTFAPQNSNDSIQESWLFDGFEPVLGALVIISDNEGTIDTLVNARDSIYDYNRDMEGNIVDSFIIVNPKAHFLGYYQTSNLKGKAGNTYYLKIVWQDKEFTSSCFMSPVPKIDSLTYSFTQGAKGKDDYYIPHIWFKDNPATEDYYLFCTTGSGGVWARVVLSDENIKTTIVGLDVFKGESPDWWMHGYPSVGSFYKITMNSVTKEIFDYYKALISQFRNDGGVYTPSPASPPSNISNGALGYFRASAVQTVEDIMPYPSLK
jgi:hypothetical protein